VADGHRDSASITLQYDFSILIRPLGAILSAHITVSGVDCR
jgi:hypothetical protein